MQNTQISSHAETSLTIAPGANPTRPRIVRAADMPFAQGPGESGAFLMTGAETAGRVTIAVAEIDVNAGPPPHVHADAEEIFLVQSGALELLANGEIVEARAGDVAYLARGEAHRFRGLDSGETNRMHAIVAPSGFEEFMKRWIPLFDNGAPDMNEAVRLCNEYNIALYPSDDLAPPPPAQSHTKLIRAGSQESLSVLGTNVTVLLRATDTQGRYALVRIEGPRDSGPPLHLHELEDELFLIEEGSVEFTLGHDTVVAEMGDVVWGPRNHAHTFRIISDYARITVFITPGGVEQFFVECAQMENPHPAELVALSERFGISYPQMAS
ncbi:hypothetical protein IAD21_04477 [Abditibacteriota bacterium]|nr:hypothetical protein IAD21_04477 [Abditibacteriota bacterium]